MASSNCFVPCSASPIGSSHFFCDQGEGITLFCFASFPDLRLFLPPLRPRLPPRRAWRLQLIRTYGLPSERRVFGGSSMTSLRPSAHNTTTTKFNLPRCFTKPPLIAFPDVAFSATRTASDKSCLTDLSLKILLRSSSLSSRKETIFPAAACPLLASIVSSHASLFLIVSTLYSGDAESSNWTDADLDPGCNCSEIAIASARDSCTRRNWSSKARSELTLLGDEPSPSSPAARTHSAGNTVDKAKAIANKPLLSIIQFSKFM